MRYMAGLALAVALILSTSRETQAQVGISIGNPYYGPGVGIAAPGFSYSSGYAGYSPFGYGVNSFSNTGYLAGPGTFAYSSGYRGYGTPLGGYGIYGRPYGYGGYGYGYGYGARGYRPFRGIGRMLR